MGTITLKEFKWSNAFSYGENNKIDFSKRQLTQLVGKNGGGKSSVALILEELLFNKNSKGVKKADILNRYSGAKSYSASLTFSDGTDEYELHSTRGTTQTVKLLKNGENISGHTTTQTYAMLEKLFRGHKLFTQLVTVSNYASLEFLSSADTARKKFLIDILGLESYSEYHDIFKQAAKQASEAVAACDAKLQTITSFINKYNNTALTDKEVPEVPQLDQELLDKQFNLSKSLSELDSTNKKISANNKYKEILAGIQINNTVEKPVESVEPLNKALGGLDQGIKEIDRFIKKMQSLHGTCPECLSKIDESAVQSMVEAKQVSKALLQSERAELQDKIAKLTAAHRAWEQSVKAHSEWERINSTIDWNMGSDLLDESDLGSELLEINSKISALKRSIDAALKLQQECVAHNSKVSVIRQQLEEMRGELVLHQAELDSLQKKLNNLNILTKTFSTTGLVAYKIECLVKDLEQLANEYLVDLSDGRFQLSFEISSSDKLNVIVNDNGKNIDFQSLSGGEKARVNVATLLGIRKLMQSLSSSKINLLFLDETIDVLDTEGKDRLIEVLLAEENLNVVIVSHGYYHPLLEQVTVTKTGNVSKLDSGE